MIAEDAVQMRYSFDVRLAFAGERATPSPAIEAVLLKSISVFDCPLNASSSAAIANRKPMKIV